MRKSVINCFLFLVIMWSLLFVSYNASASSILSLIQEGPNQASDEDREYLIDRVIPVVAGNPKYGQLDIGDSLAGLVNMTTLNSSSANVGGLTGNNELSAVYQVLVTDKVDLGGGLFLLSFGPDPDFTDPNTGLTGTEGVIAVLYEDTTPDFAADFNSPTPSTPPAGPDDGTPIQTVPPSSADVSVGPFLTEKAFIATATDGTWFATLGWLGPDLIANTGDETNPGLGEGANYITTIPFFDNVLTGFIVTSGTTGANINIGLNLIDLNPAYDSLKIIRITPSLFPIGSFVDFAMSQQIRGVNDLDTPFELSSNTNISFNATFKKECNVDIEKLVRKYQTNDPFVDADQCTDADVPVITIPGGAEYKLIVTNTGDSTLTNCRITDAQLGIDYSLGISLDEGQIVEFNGSVIPQLTAPDRCQAAGQLTNTATIVCDCADVPGQQATDSDDACVKCKEDHCCLEIIKTATPVELTCVEGLWWLTNRCKCCKTFGCIQKCCTVPKVKYTYKIKNLCDPVKNVKVVDNKFGTIALFAYLGTGEEKIITKTKCVCNTTTNIATVKGYLVSDPVTFCTDSDTETVTVSKPW